VVSEVSKAGDFYHWPSFLLGKPILGGLGIEEEMFNAQYSMFNFQVWALTCFSLA